MNKNHIAIFFYNSLILKKKIEEKSQGEGLQKVCNRQTGR